MQKSLHIDQSQHLEQIRSLGDTLIMPMDGRPSIVPPTAAFQDISTPYSAVSSFNAPAQCDPSLLTPKSSGASPPMHNLSKFPHRYPAPPDTPKQEPSPASSSMYNWGQFVNDGPSSQTGSPMHQPTSHDYAEQSYMPDERHTPGPPSEIYVGRYGVSDGAPGYHHSVQSSDGYIFNHVQGSSIMDTSMPMDLSRNSTGIPSPAAGGISAHHAHAHYRQSYPDAGHAAPATRPDARGRSSTPARRAAKQTRVRGSKAASRGGKPTHNRSPNHGLDSAVEENTNCYGEEVPAKLKDNTPPEERFIYEMRWKYRNEKGNDMWTSILNEVQKHFDKEQLNKARLQMKVRRLRTKYIEWLPEDLERLRQAFLEVEKERYQRVEEIFYALGGSRNMGLSTNDFEHKIVTGLKLEEDVYIKEYPQVGVRRRHRQGKKKTRNARQDDEDDEPSSDEATSASQVPTAVRSQTLSEEQVFHQIYEMRENGTTYNTEMTDVQLVDGRRLKQEPGATHHHAGHGITQESEARASGTYGPYSPRRRA